MTSLVKFISWNHGMRMTTSKLKKPHHIQLILSKSLFPQKSSSYDCGVTFLIRKLSFSFHWDSMFLATKALLLQLPMMRMSITLSSSYDGCQFRKLSFSFHWGGTQCSQQVVSRSATPFRCPSFPQSVVIMASLHL